MSKWSFALVWAGIVPAIAPFAQDAPEAKEKPITIEVVGAVAQPTNMVVAAYTTVIEGLIMAGGLNRNAGSSVIRLTGNPNHATPTLLEWNHHEMCSSLGYDENTRLADGDIVLVPPAAPHSAHILGIINAPDAILVDVKKHPTLGKRLRTIAFGPYAQLRRVLVFRKQAQGVWSMTPFNYKAYAEDPEGVKDMPLESGDIIVIGYICGCSPL